MDFTTRHRRRIAVAILVLVSGIYVGSKLMRPASEQDEQLSSVPSGGQVPAEIAHGDRSQKIAIFTFDAGEGAQSVGPILATLKKHGVKGTFFITGRWAVDNPELTRRISAEGHEIFNHTFTHPYLTETSDEEIHAELSSTDATIEGITGTTTKPYFRPPYGSRDDRVLKIAAEAGYRSVYWTIDALDWKESAGKTAEEVRQRILSNLQPGMVILMHVGNTITGSILDGVFSEIHQQGYRIVSLTEGLAK